MHPSIALGQYAALQALCWHIHSDFLTWEEAASLYAANAPFASLYAPLSEQEKDLLRKISEEFPRHDFSGWKRCLEI